MLNIDQLAKQLAVSRNTVVSLIKKGELKALKIGDQYRIPEENYRSFISNTSVNKKVLLDIKGRPLADTTIIHNDEYINLHKIDEVIRKVYIEDRDKTDQREVQIVIYEL